MDTNIYDQSIQENMLSILNKTQEPKPLPWWSRVALDVLLLTQDLLVNDTELGAKKKWKWWWGSRKEVVQGGVQGLGRNPFANLPWHGSFSTFLLFFFSSSLLLLISFSPSFPSWPNALSTHSSLSQLKWLAVGVRNAWQGLAFIANLAIIWSRGGCHKQAPWLGGLGGIRAGGAKWHTPPSLGND